MPKVAPATTSENQVNFHDCYTSHGLALSTKPGDTNGVGECLFCGREKFAVNSTDGKYQCFVCGETGNVYTFLRKLWEESFNATKPSEYQTLADDRGLLDSTTLIKWNLAKSILTDEWLIPGYGLYKPEMNLATLYRYITTSKRKLLLPTEHLGHQIFGGATYNHQADTVYFCEGIWDAIALWEAFSIAKHSGESLIETTNESASLLKDATVLATPGANVFKENWYPYFRRKNVVLMAQNDHPRLNEKTQKHSPPASYNAMKKFSSMLLAEGAKSIKILYWGPDGYNKDLPTGYDVRDLLVKG